MTTGLSSGLKSTGYKQIVTPLQDQSQKGLSQMLYQALQGGGGFQQGLGNLAKLAGGDQSAFSQMEAPALRQFGALQGNLASRFSGMGSGARQSSGFQNTASEAGTDLAERLAAKRMDYQQQALAQLLGLSESLLNRPTFQTGFIPKKESMWKSLLGSASHGFGQGLGMLPGLFI